MGWVENAVHNLDVSLASKGRFDLDCDQIKRKPFEKLANMLNVVVFRVGFQRVRDFIDGEEGRALCKLSRDHTYKAKEDEARIVGETFIYCFGKERKKIHHAKPASAPVLERAPGASQSKICSGDSSKLGCTYSLSWHEFNRGGQTYAAVIVRNNGMHVKNGDTQILHGPDSVSVFLTLTNECKQFVRQWLLQGNNTEHIIQSAHTHSNELLLRSGILMQYMRISMLATNLLNAHLLQYYLVLRSFFIYVVKNCSKS
jgi:hypothetical protein